MSETKVAVVTGSNKGIGLAIVKGLCKKFNGNVYLTSRNEARGQSAIKELKDLGLNPYFHQLDVDNDESVNTFRDYLKQKYGGVDLLVNNAAIAYVFTDQDTPVAEQAEKTIRTNYFGVLRVCKALFPILRENAQVVNISSSAGHLSRIPSQELRDKLSNATLTVDELSRLMNQFVSEAKAGTHEQNGWAHSYVVSKVGVSALTRIQQREFDNETPNRNISVNSVHPGFVDTEMTAHKGPLTVDEGASAPLYLSLAEHGLKGQYVWNDCKVIDWFAPAAPQLPPSKN